MADENEEEPQEVWPKKGSFVFPTGGRYGWCPHMFPFHCSLSCPTVACSAVTFYNLLQLPVSPSHTVRAHCMKRCLLFKNDLIGLRPVS